MSGIDSELRAALRALGRESEPAEALEPIGLATAPVVGSGAARARLLRSVEDGGRYEGFVERCARLLDFGDPEARELLARIGDPEADGSDWVAGRVEGSHYFHFPGGPRIASASCGLVSIEPGVVFPAHRHAGLEVSIILAGRGIEDSGVEFVPGDTVVREPGSRHEFRAVGDEPLVFVVVLAGEIEFD